MIPGRCCIFIGTALCGLAVSLKFLAARCRRQYHSANMDAPDNKDKPNSGAKPTHPTLPREGFDDAQKLAELRRQAQQRMREEEKAASNVPTDPHGVPFVPVAPVYGGPPTPSPSDANRVNQTVYGAPAFR